MKSKSQLKAENTKFSRHRTDDDNMCMRTVKWSMRNCCKKKRVKKKKREKVYVHKQNFKPLFFWSAWTIEASKWAHFLPVYVRNSFKHLVHLEMTEINSLKKLFFDVFFAVSAGDANSFIFSSGYLAPLPLFSSSFCGVGNVPPVWYVSSKESEKRKFYGHSFTR